MIILRRAIHCATPDLARILVLVKCTALAEYLVTSDFH